jgi:hypothetical protein
MAGFSWQRSFRRRREAGSSGKAQGYSDADIKQAIVFGKGKMKPVTTLTVSPDDIVAYVRT